MEKINRFIIQAYNSLEGVLINWLVIIGTLILLLIIFKCFQSTLNLAVKELKKVSKTALESLPKSRRKKDEAPAKELTTYDLKKMQKKVVKIKRYILAYYYDHNTDFDNKEILNKVEKIHNSIRALRNPKLMGNTKGIAMVIKNISTQSEETIKLIDQLKLN